MRIYTRKRTDGLIEAFHILTKTNGRKVKMFETSSSHSGAKRKLRTLMSPMYRPETAYQLVKS